MFWFGKKKKKEKKTEEKKETAVVKDHFVRGMYCDVCGYMQINDTDGMPLEGFALCPNCGAPLKAGWFIALEDGTYTLADKKADEVAEKEADKPYKKQSGGHYRVRKAGPARVVKHVSHHR
ncbi:MAG: hypothetical protein PUA69_02585 [Erysipelotrichaceae bacterium]|nr:hypothetical protein [Erysipelotrichaceae bacterium]